MECGKCRYGEPFLIWHRQFGSKGFPDCLAGCLELAQGFLLIRSFVVFSNPRVSPIFLDGVLSRRCGKEKSESVVGERLASRGWAVSHCGEGIGVRWLSSTTAASKQASKQSDRSSRSGVGGGRDEKTSQRKDPRRGIPEEGFTVF